MMDVFPQVAFFWAGFLYTQKHPSKPPQIFQLLTPLNIGIG